MNLLAIDIVREREKHKLTQKDLSILTEIDPSTLSFIENGKTLPSKVTAIKLAKALNKEDDYYLHIMNNMKKSGRF